MAHLSSAKRYDKAVALSEEYFALNRPDNRYFAQHVAKSSAHAHYRLGRHARGLQVLDRYAPGEQGMIRRLLQAGLRGQ